MEDGQFFPEHFEPGSFFSTRPVEHSSLISNLLDNETVLGCPDVGFTDLWPHAMIDKSVT